MTGEPNGEDSPPEDQGVEFFVPPENEPGTYANTFAIWDTAYDFVFDFAVFQLPQPSDPADPDSAPVFPARVVSRVILPRSLIFEFVKTISARMDFHEKNWGPIEHPTLFEDGEDEDERTV